MRQIAPVVVVAGALALPVAVTADAPRPLGTIAAEKEKEKEKEKDKKKPPAKVFTEADLYAGRGGSGTVSRPAAEGTATAPAGSNQKAATGDQKAPAATPSEKPKTEEELRAERQNDWRDRMEKARAEVARLTDVANRLQTSLNDLTGPIYGSGRAARQQQLDEAKRSLATAQQQVADLEEEGRRNSYR